MKKIKDLGEKEVILCTTLEECNAIGELLDKEGFMWDDGDSYIECKPWISLDIEQFCFYPHDGEWCWLNYYKEYDYTIHAAKDFFPESPQKLYTSQEVKVITNALLSDILSEWAEGKFQKGLNVIIRERLNN